MFYLVGLVCNDTGSNRDRADAHVAVEDVPAFIAGVVRSAAGKSGHAPMIPPIEPRGKPLQIAAVGLAHLGVEHMLRRLRRPHNTPVSLAENGHADCVGYSIFFRISSQTDLTSAVTADACSMRSKISFASSRYFCAVSWT